MKSLKQIDASIRFKNDIFFTNDFFFHFFFYKFNVERNSFEQKLYSLMECLCGKEEMIENIQEEEAFRFIRKSV